MSNTKIIDLEVRTGSSQKDVESLGDGITNLKDGIDDIPKATSKASKGFKGLGNAIAATGVGAALLIFKKMIDVFKENQIVLDAFSVTFEATSLIFNDFFNYLNNNVGNVIGYFKALFEDPQQNARDFGKAVQDNIIERFNSALEVIGHLATAFKKVFERDFAGAMESAKMAGKEYVDVLTGVDGSVDKVSSTISKAATGIADYTKSTVDAAKSNVDLTKSAEVAAVKQQGLVEKYDRQAELQRQIRDDESKSIEERVAANTKLGKILDEQEAAMLKQVDIQLAAAQAQFDKNGNQENLVALLQAENEKAAVQAQIAGFRSEQLTNINSLERERVDLIKEERENDLEFFAEEADRKAKEEEDKKKAHEEELKQKEEIRQATLNNLDTIIAVAGEETKIGRALFIAKQAMLVKEQIAKAKATLTEITLKGVAAGVDASAGFMKTASAGFPQNVPLLIAFGAQVAGIFGTIKSASNAAKGAASKMGGSGGGSSVSSPRISASAASIPPAFNVVGASETNQLAQSIGQDEKQPIKAFVVSNDVSNAQALDRNIVENASIG